MNRLSWALLAPSIYATSSLYCWHSHPNIEGGEVNYFLKQLFHALALLVYENSWVSVSLATALVLPISSGCTRDFGNSGCWW